MDPPLPSITKLWHNDIYPSISPTLPSLSAANKKVIILGAGSGVGRATALAFAAANASKVVLAGRTEASLQQTAALLPPSVPHSVHVADVTDAAALQAVASAEGTWDVLILAAAYMSPPRTIARSEVEDWWQTFETIVKGAYLAARAFIPTANSTHAAIVGVTSLAATVPAALQPGLSHYASSKLAQIKLFEFIAAEHPHIFAATLHPGMIETAMFRKAEAKADQLPMDTPELPAHFLVWLTSAEGAFLNGRMVAANWDVEELKAKGEGIQKGGELLPGMAGWPFTAA